MRDSIRMGGLRRRCVPQVNGKVTEQQDAKLFRDCFFA